MFLFELRIHVAGIARPRSRGAIVVNLGISGCHGRRGRLIALNLLIALSRLIGRVRRNILRPISLARRHSLSWPIRIALRHVLTGHRRVLRWSGPGRRGDPDVRARCLRVFRLSPSYF